jgi:hypothetical protein
MRLTIERWEAKQVTSQTLKTELNSTLLKNMGAILYQGKDPTEADCDVTAPMLVKEFIRDGAAGAYAYSSSREDLAMLVETSLMYYYLDYSSFETFIKYPYKNYVMTNDFNWAIGGGVINKMTDDDVKERTQDVLNKFFGPEMSARVITKLKKTYPVIIHEDASWSKFHEAFL